MQECNIAEKEERYRISPNHSSGSSRLKTDYLAISVLLLDYFLILFIYVLLETLVVPLCLDMYAWTAEFTVKIVGIALTIASLITFFMFILGGKLAKKFGDRKVFIICGLIPLTIALVLFFPVAGKTPRLKQCPNFSQNSTDLANNDTTFSPDFTLNSSDKENLRVRREALSKVDDCQALGCPPSQEWCSYTPIIHIPQMLTASLLITIGYPISISLSGAIFSKMLRVKSQVLWMGILTSFGSLSRFLGPIFVSYLYTSKGPLWTFAILFILFIFILILTVIFYKRMKPISKKSSQSRFTS